MKKWENNSKTTFTQSNFSSSSFIAMLLANRGLKTKKEIESFLHPKLESVTIDSVDIDKKQLTRALKRIQNAVKKKEHIIIFGDYDVDGICGTAILWEMLYMINSNVMPYIPHRIDEGYGLSIKGIDHVLEKYPDIKLIITVDNGIVATKAVDYAREKKIEVIITDHHVVGEKIPHALAIVHTTKLCGTGVAYLLAQKIQNIFPEIKLSPKKNHLELVALATIADLVPLLHANRVVTKEGLEALNNTQRVGILELYKEAVLDAMAITSYHVGHTIAPRINAMGRMEYAMESLRLLCTQDSNRAKELAAKLGITNKERQQRTMESVSFAKKWVDEKNLHTGKLLFIAHESYQPGIIGLIAGRLVEHYYRPSIVLSIGATLTKGSARSISGFNIIDFIRTASEHLIDAGGHPMAAGFTVETAKLLLLQDTLMKNADAFIEEKLFIRTLKIDCEILLSVISDELYEVVKQFEPFGMGNPQPVFMSKGVKLVQKRLIGKDKTHVKLKLSQEEYTFDAIGFSMAEQMAAIHEGDTIDIVYTIDENVWNGNRSLQLKIKDIH